MNPSLVTVACLAVFALAACSQESAEPVNDAPMAVEEAPPKAVEPAPVDFISTAADPESDFDQRGFAGTFTGTLPCADCPGMDVTLVLEPDGTYKTTHIYQDRPDGTWSIDGHWSVEDDNSVIRLDPNSKTEDDQLYGIDSQDRVVMLDTEGEPIETELDYGLSREIAQ